MIKGIIIVCIAMLIICNEIPGMIREKAIKQIIVFSVLIVLGTVYLFDLEFHLNLPNPTRGITAMFNPLMKWVENKLT